MIISKKKFEAALQKVREEEWERNRTLAMRNDVDRLLSRVSRLEGIIEGTVTPTPPKNCAVTCSTERKL